MVRHGRFFRRHYILPGEHGAWIWLLGPLIVGAVAGQEPGPAFLWVALAALAGFMIRQPLTIVVKVLAGRRASGQLAPAAVWTGVYALSLALAAAGLIRTGQAKLLVLGIVAAPVTAWHLWLVAQRSDRRRPGVEIVAAGVLALGAPAAYWTNQGRSDVVAWTLWLLVWLQAAASIVQVHFRLSRRWSQDRLVRVNPWRVLGYHAVAALVAAVAVSFELAPSLTAVAFSVPLLDGLMVIARPEAQSAPRSVGLRQLAVSSAFVLLMALGYGSW